MIALIDYKAGNLTSVRKALASANAEFYTPDTAVDLARAAAIIVPGVGHFGATGALDGAWHETIRDRVAAGVPLLGICLGMQFLFEGSSEADQLPGLGLLPGRCTRLVPDPQRAAHLQADGAAAEDARGAPPPGGDDAPRCKVPHVGWNALELSDSPSRLLAGVASGAQAYFTHSYVAPDTGATTAWTTHGVRFPSVAERGLVFGAQFHPEKSGEVGLRMLQNFLEVAR